MAAANWKCRDCDTDNDPGETNCIACDTPRSSAARRPPTTAKSNPPKKATAVKSGGGAKPAAKRPAPARPTADWTCRKCDTNNTATALSCIACGTGWKAAKKAAPRKPAPKKAPAKKSAATKSTTSSAGPSRSGGGTGTGTRPRAARPTTAPREVFYPSAGSAGYTPPTTPRRTPPAASPPPPKPWTAAPYPPPAPRAPAPGGRSKDRLKGCLGVIVGLFLLYQLPKSCLAGISAGGDGDAAPDASESSAPSCPERIAAALPDGGGSGTKLVKAFRTKNKQIVLCRTGGGKLYYFGEFKDRREKGIAMSATETSDGYEARNGAYRYRIHDGVVTIYESDRRIGEEDLTPEPSPS
ncbi:zinc finger protein [Streptomyces sp. XD-27]|uniref:zinc finger protein n=1 Tax=Streptomyces sp. XD-27 TaxID=3062779 RepID=UPI0026F44523|nr:zinc finger protein [Streptomyces sp. XD-27]WKX73093.1 zinc finger protein [Streptomyces sp. XD-27]